ncbi:MAG: hypothetical protein M0Z36_13535 [Thermaerobacter sp.]|nr:hypothetical protein [Thermaerobacter sp.]
MNSGLPRTHWILWATAGFGLFLYLGGPKLLRPVPNANQTVSHTHPATSAATSHPIVSHGAAAGISAWWGPVLLGLGLVVGLGLLVALLLVLLRFRMRLRRREAMVCDEVILGPDDTASPDEVMAALDAIHGQLLTRYAGSAIGQVSWTFEVIRDPDGPVHFVIGAPHGWLQAIEDVWRSKYTNIRFQPYSEIPRTWAVTQQIVLAKHWRHPTRIVRNYQNSPIETIVQALDRAEGALRLQYVLTPIPATPLHAQLKQEIRHMEQDAQSDSGRSSAPGMADRPTIQDATQLYGKSAYRVEMRLVADEWQTMQRAFGALTETNGENRLVATTVVALRRSWLRWLNARLPSLYFFRSNILFSAPLAAFIHLPSARLRVNALNRQLVRRGPAPRGIVRSPQLALMRDETGLVGIAEGDRKYNVLLMGSQGSGKTTGLLSIVRVDANWRDAQGLPKAMALIDIGKDTAHRALGMIPTDREVVWFDPADPLCPWYINPLNVSGSGQVVADHVLEGLTQVFGEESIRSRSREFLGNAILAVREVLGPEADFTHMYRLLAHDEFRQDIIDRVQSPHQKDYWQGTFLKQQEINPRFAEESLAAPRNKLDEVLRNDQVAAALTGSATRHPINFRDIVTGRKVFVANLDKAKLGKNGARLIGVMLLTMLWQALEHQTDIPEADRVPCSIIVDEAQNFIADNFLDILAEGRAYGAQTTVAVRFLGEIASEKVAQGLQALAQNIILYQFELLDEAKDYMQRFARVFANMITTSDESQDALNFGADDFMRLPKFSAVCRFMANGTPQQAFLAQTLPWEDHYDDRVAQYHRNQQPAPRSAMPLTPPPDAGIRIQPDPKPHPSVSAPQPLTLTPQTPEGDDPAVAAARIVSVLARTPEGRALLDSLRGGDPEAPTVPESPSPAPDSPEGSEPTDGLAAFSERYRVPSKRLLSMAATFGVDEAETAKAAQWVVDHRVADKVALARLEKLLRAKGEDKFLTPVSAQLGIDRDQVREVAKQHDLTLQGLSDLCAEHPELRSTKALDALLQTTPR